MLLQLLHRFPHLLRVLVAFAVIAILATPFVVSSRDQGSPPTPKVPPIQTVGASVMLRLQREGAPVYDFRQSGQKIPGALRVQTGASFKYASDIVLIGDEKQTLPLAQRILGRTPNAHIYLVNSAMVTAYPDFSGVRQIEPRKLAQLMKVRKIRIFDFAESEEFVWSRVPGSTRIAWQSVIGSGDGFLPPIRKGETVALICPVGSRSQLAAQKLKRAGVQVLNVRGGMYAWQNAGLPLDGAIVKRSHHDAF